MARDCKSIQQKQTLLTAFTIYLLFALKITIMLLLKEVFRSQRRIIKTICKRLIQFFLLNIRDLRVFLSWAWEKYLSLFSWNQSFLMNWTTTASVKMWTQTWLQSLRKNHYFSVKSPFLLKIRLLKRWIHGKFLSVIAFTFSRCDYEKDKNFVKTIFFQNKLISRNILLVLVFHTGTQYNGY